MTATPWGHLLATAARMGLRPADFWRLGVREWRLLIEASAPADQLGRAEFDRLLNQFPDMSPFPVMGQTPAEEERDADLPKI